MLCTLSKGHQGEAFVIVSPSNRSFQYLGSLLDGETCQPLKYFSMAMNNDYYTFNDRPERVGKRYKNFTDIKENNNMTHGYSINIMSSSTHGIFKLRTVY